MPRDPVEPEYFWTANQRKDAQQLLLDVAIIRALQNCEMEMTDKKFRKFCDELALQLGLAVDRPTRSEH